MTDPDPDPVVLKQYHKSFLEVLKGQHKCNLKEHFQQVTVSVHANQYTRICFDCYLVEFTSLPLLR